MRNTFSSAFDVIKDGIETLDSKNSANEGAQLEVYFNGKITLQIFHSMEIIESSMSLPFELSQKHVLGVLFGNSIESWFRLRRFKKTNDFNLFHPVKYEHENLKVYFKELDDSLSIEEKVKYVVTLLKTLKPSKKNFTINAAVMGYQKD